MRRGFSLIELIVYVSIFVLVFILFTDSLVSISKSYGELKAIKDLDTAAMISLDRVIRDVRGASNIDMTQSVFGGAPGTLVIDQMNFDGNVITTKFNVVDGVFHVWQNGLDTGSLLPSGITVSQLAFYSIDSGVSKGVRVEMRFAKQSGVVTRYANYYSTIILRGSYK